MPIQGTGGNDTLTGNSSSETIQGFGGNDSISGGGGADVLYGGSGNDTISGGSGLDSLYGEAGDDRLLGADDSRDYFSGGDGNDTILAGGASGDTLDGGAGSDQLRGGGGNDILLGGNDGDSLWGDAGNDNLDAGAGNDLVLGGTGNDQAQLGDGNDSFGSALQGDEGGNDSVWGGAGADQILGGSGGDGLYGGGGADLIDGGSGDDLISGGSGLDTLTGGTGRDTFQAVSADSGDVITDFDLTIDAEGMTTDRLDTSALVRPNGGAVRSWDVGVTDNGVGSAVLIFPSGETLVLQGVSPATLSSPSMLTAMGVPCFAAGTMIETPSGPRAVETLAEGDAVLTASGESLAILWAGGRRVVLAGSGLRPHERPVRLRPGAIGNSRALVLSPQHAVAVPGMAGLARARHLVGALPGVRIARGMRGVSYHHLLLPRHDLIRLSGGGLAESFYPGPHALAGLSPVARDRLVATLLATGLARRGEGGAADLSPYGPRCLPVLSRQALARALAGVPQRITLPLTAAPTRLVAAVTSATLQPAMPASRTEILPASPKVAQSSKTRRNCAHFLTPAE